MALSEVGVNCYQDMAGAAILAVCVGRWIVLSACNRGYAADGDPGFQGVSVNRASERGIGVRVNEVEVHITECGEGRAAIIQRDDGAYCIYVHWMWPEAGGRTTWRENTAPLDALYEAKEPRQGLYATVADARNEINSLPGFGRKSGEV